MQPRLAEDKGIIFLSEFPSPLTGLVQEDVHAFNIVAAARRSNSDHYFDWLVQSFLGRTLCFFQGRALTAVFKTRQRKAPAAESYKSSFVSNADLAELLAREADGAKPPLTRAFRRAARRAFLWPEEAFNLFQVGRSLTELSSIGPYLENIIRRWLEKPPAISDPPPLRSGFLTLTQAQSILARDPSWLLALKGDLQMHSEWSDGSGFIGEMAEAAIERNYEYIAITDHSKGLKIARGIDEDHLQEQAAEIAGVNQSLQEAGKRLRTLRSIELNLNPRGDGDMDVSALSRLDIVLGCFHSSLRSKEDQTGRYLAALRNPAIQILGLLASTPAPRFIGFTNVLQFLT